MSETNKDKQLQEADFSNFEAANEEEIEFDDNIDIEALQAKLQQHMSSDDIDYTPASAVVQDTAEPEQTDFEIETLDGSNAIVPLNDEDVNKALELENFVQSFEDGNNQAETNTQAETAVEPPSLPEKPKEDEKLKLKLGEKKYIVYIEPDNIDFLDSITIRERKKIINRILREEDENIRKKRQTEERIKFTNQVIIMVLTVVISLPIFFVLLNKSIEITILNYQQAQQNFVKLYKEQGKIKSYKKFQKNFN
ncbi:hypothetical protein IJ843_01360 [bacterium]|nr:hypothetical protein [bacterium]